MLESTGQFVHFAVMTLPAAVSAIGRPDRQWLQQWGPDSDWRLAAWFGDGVFARRRRVDPSP